MTTQNLTWQHCTNGHDPSFGYDLEADRSVGSFDDFNIEMRRNFCQGGGELRSLISAVGEELGQERECPEQGRHDENAAIAILDIGRMNHSVEQEA
jgi:hypothetical protein